MADLGIPTPPPTRIGAEAHRRLQVWKTTLVSRWTALDQLRPQLQATAIDFLRRSSTTGRQRVFGRVDRQVQSHGGVLWDLRLGGDTPLALWATLKPRGPVFLNPIDPGHMQDCVSLDYLMFGAVLGPHSAGQADGLWTVEFSDHALLTLLQRQPGADLSAALLEAHHNALLVSATALGTRLGQIPTPENGFWLPAADGAFCCNARVATEVTTGLSLNIRARTWLHRDQMRGDQIPLPVGALGDRVGDGLALPAPLRRIVQKSSRVRVYPRPWIEGFGMPASGRRH